MGNLDLHTLPEAMKILRIKDRRTMKRLLDSGKLPRRETTGGTMFTDDDLLDYIRSCRRVGFKDEPRPVGNPRQSVDSAFRDVITAMESLRSLLMNSTAT